MKQGAKGIAKIIVLLAIIGAIIAALCVLLTPKFYDTHESTSVTSLYEQPENTIQAAFIGTSTILSGVSTVQLYEEQGICAYSIASGSQPLLASKYWLQEIERLHPESLKLAVIDPSMLFPDSEDADRAEPAVKSISKMALSPIKLEAMLECDRHFPTYSIVENLLPAMTYHSRWNELTSEDYEELFGKKVTDHSRGQRIDFRMALDTLEPSEIPLPHKNVTEKIDYSKREIGEFVNAYSLRMLTDMVSFCKEQGISVMLCKMPKAAWTNLRHDATQYFADQLDIPFIDFNLTTLEEELKIDWARDFYDNTHLNVNGANKITAYLEKFIGQHFDLEDVRENPRYDFMIDDISEHEIVMKLAKLSKCDNLNDYIDLLDDDRLTIFTGVYGDVAPLSGTDEGIKLANIGFSELGKTRDPNRAYSGIVNAGKLVMEKVRNEGNPIYAMIEGKYEDGEITALMKLNNQPNAVPPIRFVTLGVCGASSENRASVWLNDEELSEEGAGINFVVFDRVLNLMVDSSCFDFNQPGCPRICDEIPKEYLERLEEAGFTQPSH